MDTGFTKRRKLRPPGQAFQEPGMSFTFMRTSTYEPYFKSHVRFNYVQSELKIILYFMTGASDRKLTYKGNGLPIYSSNRDATFTVDAPMELVYTLRQLVQETRPLIPNVNVHSLVDDGAVWGNLHLSLSRPLQLWTAQKADFANAVRHVLQGRPRFKLTLASLSVLTNDEGSRSFLTCEVGFGYGELSSITASLNEVLRQNRLPSYYAEPRFHVSIAWWIPRPDLSALSVGESLSPSGITGPSTAMDTDGVGMDLDDASADDAGVQLGKRLRRWSIEEAAERPSSPSSFISINTLELRGLEEKYGASFRGYELPVDCVLLRMGRDTTRHPLV